MPKTDKAPRDYWVYHSPECGTKYRGCAPDCPKEVFEKTGKWTGPEQLTWVQNVMNRCYRCFSTHVGIQDNGDVTCDSCGETVPADEIKFVGDKLKNMLDPEKAEDIQLFSEYEHIVGQEWHPDHDVLPGLGLAALGLAGEAGEVTDEVKKVYRNDGGKLYSKRQNKILLEMGDVLFYLQALAIELGVSLSDIATLNRQKLHERRN